MKIMFIIRARYHNASRVVCYLVHYLVSDLFNCFPAAGGGGFNNNYTSSTDVNINNMCLSGPGIVQRNYFERIAQTRDVNPTDVFN